MADFYSLYSNKYSSDVTLLFKTEIPAGAPANAQS